ncbi:putative quinol monooxygenase [Sphingomonas sp. BT-65]|uniref:putative quinol monooxygenase n=1 Tax=Sphingomonas sp. BT-65 TaxID=2989821 RepID=UPI003555FB46
MRLGRRQTIAGGLAIALLAPQVKAAERINMFGLLGKMRAQPGKRAELIAILLEGTDAMPGCKAYIVAEDVKEPDAIWITEVWDKAESHKASLQLPAVQAAIAKGRPLIAGFDSQVELNVAGGVGL